MIEIERNDIIDLPSYEHLMDETQPPAYEEAIKLPSVFTPTSISTSNEDIRQ